MASSSAALYKTTTKQVFHSKYLTINQFSVQHAVAVYKNKQAAGLCTCINMLSKWPNIISTKRKLCFLTVISRSAEKLNLGANSCVKDSGLDQVSHSKDAAPVNSFGIQQALYFNTNGNKQSSYNLILNHSWRLGTIHLTSPTPLINCQHVRHFSKRRRNGNRRDEHGKNNEDDDDDEKKKEEIKGAVMYVANPMTWVSKKWNIARLQHSLDPEFSESEFLEGAKQAVSHVSQMVSSGHFDQLTGLVEEEVIDRLMSLRNSLASVERSALALSVEDVALIKLRHLQLDLQQEKPVALVDAVCFGLRLLDKVPFLVDVGISFRRDYSTDPPGDWVVANVSHVRVQNLAAD